MLIHSVPPGTEAASLVALSCTSRDHYQSAKAQPRLWRTAHFLQFGSLDEELQKAVDSGKYTWRELVVARLRALKIPQVATAAWLIDNYEPNNGVKCVNTFCLHHLTLKWARV